MRCVLTERRASGEIAHVELIGTTIARLMGIPQEDRHSLFAWANVTLDHDDHDLGESTARQAEASAEMFAYGTALIAEKVRCPADDILSAVANATIPSPAGEGDEPLADLEVQMFFNLLIAAGSETTRNSIAGGLLAFTENPDQWRLLHDRSLLPGAVEEILRHTSSTAYNRRTATVDVELHGRTISAGDKVTLWWPSANHDEAVFADPYRFDITRQKNRHLAFGHGSHFCLGANLARLEMKVVFDALLDRVDHVELLEPPEWTRSNKHTGLRHLRVGFTRCGG